MKTWKRITRRGLLTLVVTFAGLILTAPQAQGQILYDQSGPLITAPGGGCPSNLGLKNDSEIQNQTPFCVNILGFGANNGTTGAIRVADDFTLTRLSNVTGFRFFAYQTGSPAGPPPTSTMTGAFAQIWTLGPPGLGGIPLASTPGTANLMTSTAWSVIYRTSETGPNVDLCNRGIMSITATLTTPVSLPAGTYWVSWGLTGSLASGPFVPTLTVEAGPPPPGNARQTLNTGATWAQLFDAGVVGCIGQPPAPGYSNDLAFQVLGTVDPCGQSLPPCEADIAPIGGNGFVNVDDLLGVINTWGMGQVPPGTGPRPQGDCAPPPTGNCFVNVDDLLEVINNWGPCPLPATCPTAVAAMAAASDAFIALTGLPIVRLSIVSEGVVLPNSANLRFWADREIATSAIPILDLSMPGVFDTGLVPSYPSIPPSMIAAYRSYLMSTLSGGDTALRVNYMRTDGGPDFSSLAFVATSCTVRWDSLINFAVPGPPEPGPPLTGDGGGIPLLPQQYQCVKTSSWTQKNGWGSVCEHFSVTATVDCNRQNQPILCTGTASGTSGCFAAAAEGKVASQTIVGNCCRVVANFAYATGFKSVKVGADGFTLEIEGSLGCSGTFSDTVLACCQPGCP